MAPQAQAQIEEEVVEIVPGTEGTPYEGMSEEDIERALFADEIEKDPDLDDEPVKAKVEPEPEPEPEPEVEGEPVAAEPEKEPEKEPELPTGLEWIEQLPEGERKKATEFIQRQGQAIARLDQRVKSHLGQLQPAQRAVAQMRNQIRELEGKLSKQQPTESPVIADKIKSYNEWVDSEYSDFPEEAQKLKTQFAESLDGVQRVLQAAVPSRQQSQVPAGPNREEEVQHLSTAYSDWGERRYSPEFDQWIATQPPETVQLLNSPFAADNVALLDAFTNDNPDWTAPQSPDQFYSLRQAQHSPLFRGWAAGEGINPDVNVAAMPDYQRDSLMTRFKKDLGTVLNEIQAEATPTTNRLAQRRKQQLQDRDPGSRRLGVKPGQAVDLDTAEGQRAYYEQLLAADPDLK